jgi:hypothetical protein
MSESSEAAARIQVWIVAIMLAVLAAQGIVGIASWAI